MAKLWKGLRGIVKKENKISDQAYSVFSKEMTLKLVFVGGHEAGKTSIVRILNKQKFTNAYDPTIGIDQHKIRLENTEHKESLWIWDVSHAELGGVHESLIYHQAHGIVLVADLTNFTSIQAIDQWLHSISIHLKIQLESQQLSMDDNDDDNNINIINKNDDDDKDDNVDDDKKLNLNLNKNKLKKKKKKNQLIPRLYLLVTKYDLSSEAILTDTQLHKFCKSNSIRAFARISSKLDKRNEMIEIFSKFSEDIIRNLPSSTAYHILQNENDRFRYNYAINRLQRNKINKIKNDDNNIDNIDNHCIFNLRNHSIRTFKWYTSAHAHDKHNNNNNNNDNDNDSDDDNSDDNNININPSFAQNQLNVISLSARRVLTSMRESIKLLSKKTIRDSLKYQKNVLKLKAMNQAKQQREYKYKNDINFAENNSKIIQNNNKNNKQNQKLLNADVITSLKLDMINGLKQEIENLTQIWEDELNTIAELIRFQIPLPRTNANLNRLKQQICARQMLFKRRIRLVNELRTQNRINIAQMSMLTQQQQQQQQQNDTQKQNTSKLQQNNTQKPKNNNNKLTNNKKTKSFFSSLVSKNDNIDVLP